MSDQMMLRLPVFGDLLSKVALSRFASTFAQLTRSGVPILQALEITAVATGNKVIGRRSSWMPRTWWNVASRSPSPWSRITGTSRPCWCRC